MLSWNVERPILVAGAGISGRNAVRLILDAGFVPILYDGNTRLNKQDIYDKVGSDQFEIVLGELPEAVAKSVNFCAISPGISLEKPICVKLREMGVPIISEIALAYHFSHGRIGAVTGTNGKTTTTALLGHICLGFNPKTFIVGNIGHAYSQEVLNTTEDSLIALELSAFQLETLDDFVPDVTIFTNLSPDHLDRYGTMERYLSVKRKICCNQREDQYCIVNAETDAFADMEQYTRARVLRFSSRRELEEGAFLRDGHIIVRFKGTEYEICEAASLHILGTHNFENAMGAVLMAFCMGVPVEVIRERVLSFNAVEHRLEYFATINGARYFNDSKGTNPDSSIIAVNSMPGPTILIAGGFDKGAEYDEWTAGFPGKVKLVILLGATAQNIADSMKRCCPNVPFRMVKDLETAVLAAKAEARPADNVLLSPACASWDMFPNFEVRGRIFKDLVRENA